MWQNVSILLSVTVSENANQKIPDMALTLIILNSMELIDYFLTEEDFDVTNYVVNCNAAVVYEENMPTTGNV